MKLKTYVTFTLFLLVRQRSRMLLLPLICPELVIAYIRHLRNPSAPLAGVETPFIVRLDMNRGAARLVHIGI